ncbi:MAG TPA: hypothetical protein ENG92_06260 [Thiolapillus brandeum]|uniref:Uncharacterized protein n=1 Tax=Thiolapillus brandeum TaxID=1076588 RepID=A0A831K667_9GAMM|nr:hypothetical protein [Thiolapillus brandeum]
MNGVFNGCKKVEKEEIAESEALDCVHEMDTINHYVGMYPIAAGGVVERPFSPFLMSFLGVMLLGFACTKPKIRVPLMSVGFAAIAIWMYMTWYGADGLKYQSAGYINALVTSMDQDTERGSDVDAGQAVIKRMQEALPEDVVSIEEMAQSADEMAKKLAGLGTTLVNVEGMEAQVGKDAGKSEDVDDKTANIELLKGTFLIDQNKKPENEREEWTGSNAQVMRWHYEKSLGRYFNNPEEIRPLVKTMTTASHVVFWGIIAAMILLVWGARKSSGILYWLMIAVPMALPLFFLIEYSAWLWWYGHNLNAMGAFTVKPFMPTVFGQGKVAQFTTHSYPAIGFGLMMLMSALLAVAALLRYKETHQK